MSGFGPSHGPGASPEGADPSQYLHPVLAQQTAYLLSAVIRQRTGLNHRVPFLNQIAERRASQPREQTLRPTNQDPARETLDIQPQQLRSGTNEAVNLVLNWQRLNSESMHPLTAEQRQLPLIIRCRAS